MLFVRYIITLLLLSCFFEVYAAEKTISLTSAEYPPYYGEKLKDKGPVTEIIAEAYKSVGYRIEVFFFPWKRGEMYARKGVYDGMFPPWHSEEREKYFVFSDPIFPNQIGFYKRKGVSIKFKSFDDLKDLVIGIVRGYVNPKGFDEADLYTVEVTYDIQNLKRLAKNRIDLALIDKRLADFLIDIELPDFRDSLEWMEPALEYKMQYLCISKKTKNPGLLINQFNKGLKSIKKSGMYHRILSKHGFDPI